MMYSDLQTYYDTLVQYQNSGQMHFLENEERRHNAAIILLMLNTSNTINMFCGEMSVFRSRFYAHVESKKTGEGVILKRKMDEALRRFIEKPGTKLNIILERYDVSFLDDLISRNAFLEGMSSGKIVVRKLNKRWAGGHKLSHCVYTDQKSVRYEENQNDHSGIYISNMSRMLEDKVVSNFDNLTKVSEPISVF